MTVRIIGFLSLYSAVANAQRREKTLRILNMNVKMHVKKTNPPGVVEQYHNSRADSFILSYPQGIYRVAGQWPLQEPPAAVGPSGRGSL